jgi:hypothetical protein
MINKMVTCIKNTSRQLQFRILKMAQMNHHTRSGRQLQVGRSPSEAGAQKRNGPHRTITMLEFGYLKGYLC